MAKPHPSPEYQCPSTTFLGPLFLPNLVLPLLWDSWGSVLWVTSKLCSGIIPEHAWENSCGARNQIRLSGV